MPTSPGPAARLTVPDLPAWRDQVTVQVSLENLRPSHTAELLITGSSLPVTPGQTVIDTDALPDGLQEVILQVGGGEHIVALDRNSVLVDNTPPEVIERETPPPPELPGLSGPVEYQLRLTDRAGNSLVWPSENQPTTLAPEPLPVPTGVDALSGRGSSPVLLRLSGAALPRTPAPGSPVALQRLTST